MTEPIAAIRYRRVPDRLDVYRQAVLEETPDRVVTFLERAGIPEPLTAGGKTILEPESPVVWFTYPGAWYDIGAFHLADGSLTGHYANVLTPVRRTDDGWETTDLCLDVWSGVAGDRMILDEAEFAAAVAAGWIDPATARTARRTADTLLGEALAGTWPPPHVRAWSLPRARARLEALRRGDVP